VADGYDAQMTKVAHELIGAVFVHGGCALPAILKRFGAGWPVGAGVR
jgi:hypothetical protein